MIETRRLHVFPLTLDQLRLYAGPANKLEDALNLPPGRRVVSEYMRSILTHFVIPQVADPDRNPHYHTFWAGLDRSRQMIIGEAKFKGEPDELDAVEIGYATHPAFQRQGYMTELVGGMMQWASQQPGIRRVVADTADENIASQKILMKNGFRLYDQVEQVLWWERLFDT